MKAFEENRARMIYDRVAADTEPTRYFYGMVILSCTVATYGLLSDSTAVVIGAMLLAPLMGPIMGGALGIAAQSNGLLKTALRTEITGALLSVLFSAFLTAVVPSSALTSEVMGRTTPSILDLIIALASGVAGTYALCAKKAGAALPGVAIATALMPPLCVVGIGLTKHDYTVASGAALLFAVNLVAINVAALATFEVLGIARALARRDDEKSGEERGPVRRMLYPVVMLVVISIPLAWMMYRTWHAAYIHKILNSSLAESLEMIAPGATLLSDEYSVENGKYNVQAVLRTTRILQPEDIRRMENLLEYRLEAPAKINADVVLVQKVNHDESYDTFGKIVMGYKQPAQETIRVETPETAVEEVIGEKLQLLKNIQLKDFTIQYRQQTGEYQIGLSLSGAGAKDITPGFLKTVSRVLEDRLKRRVKITMSNPAG